MRATHVITRLIVGGAQENTIASVLGLRDRRDMQVDLISGPSPGPEGSLESAFATTPGVLRILPELVRPIHLWNDFLAFRRLTQIFRQERPDLVHTHSGKAGVLGRLAAAKAKVPLILHTIHGPSFGAFQGKIANAIFRAAERNAAAVTTHFVSVAEAMTEQYLNAGIGKPEQFTRIWSGFPLEPFLKATNDPQVRSRWGLQPHDLVVGKIARLFPLKGHEDLLQVAPQLAAREPRLKFLLVGDGSLRRELASEVARLGLTNRFVFTGLVPPEEIPGLVGIMDVLVHLSRREGLPRALPQALAAGCPVVAYDCDGAREVCLDGNTGFLVQPDDHQGLNVALSNLLSDQELRRRLGQAGRELVRDRFSVERMVGDLYALYMKLAARRLSPHS